MADRCVPRLVEPQVDAVGNDVHREVGEVTGDEVTRRVADRDRLVELPQVGLQQRAAVVVADVRLRECMERAHVGRGGHSQHRHRQRRHQRFMEMQDVEPLFFDDRPQLFYGDAAHSSLT